jgi:beta-aspartyl-peptidase (threonine type)
LTPFLGCASSNRSGRPTQSSTRSDDGAVKAEITKVLDRQAAAWNDGDVEGFMDGYWRSPQLSFSSGGKVTRGFESTLQHFRASYPDKAAMGRLTFSDLEVTPLSADAALVLGRWRVESQKPTSGAFSLTMRRIDGQWLIIHDHTSRDAT